MQRAQKVNRILTTLACTVVAITALSQTTGRPTLVVGITIDQLRSDYIELLRSHFGQGGFNRLLRDGVCISNTTFDLATPGRAAATALIYTGAYPNVNGISRPAVYDVESKTSSPIITDRNFIGNNTDETYSPVAIKVSTLSDEVRIDNNGIGQVYAIAPNADQAIIMAGHAANGAFWINDESGKWASSTFYKDFPSVVAARNFGNALTTRIDTMKWTPAMSVNDYPDVPLHRSLTPFKYTFTGPDRVRRFKESASVNSEITDVAISCINDLRLGNRATVDMINIAYTVAPYPYSEDADRRIETEDKYIRLDRELSQLFAAIDKAVGRNAIIFVTSTGYFDNTFATEPRFRLPGGEFSSKKAVSLLNMYLMAIYGNGNWVTGYSDEQIFLNDKLAKDRNVDIVELRTRSGEFLRRMSGVSEAYTIDEIINNPVTEQLRQYQKSVYAPTAGDIFLNIIPGWTIVDDYNKTITKRQVNVNTFSTPTFIMAPAVAQQTITYPVDAAVIAPTVARLLRIRSPNAAKALPIALH